eukprot:CAMPEP_0168552282 /NCGR_PEP_ID=MMETSP0413-20121227/6633_1 /TAXON_ID=136452 /ORGANISM="Filamoeba nolandi, Strain NC-AS-23-1" /LENGTH=168 /DNA_ID=CAMNT_0008582885 /DNA_START=967 /DNA_END=1470 /DNA_ORIENTATION=+
MSLGYAVATALLILAELIRLAKIPQLEEILSDYLTQFVDEKDQGLLITSHVYLLVGCGLPLWLSCTSSSIALSGFAGLIVIGIGDSMASIVGSHIGRTKWPGSKKSIEGTAAAIISVAMTSTLLAFYIEQPTSFEQWLQLLAAGTLTCLMEAATEQVDNLFLPIFYVS